MSDRFPVRFESAQSDPAVRQVIGAAVVLAFIGLVACSDDSDSASADDPIVWSAESEGADGIAASDDSIIVVSEFLVTAHDRSTGEVRWASESSETTGPTPVVITPSGLVVIDADFDPAQAFDLATGETRPVPPDVQFPDLVKSDQRLPEGYAFDHNGLTYDGTLIWTEETTSEPFVARVGELTVINDFDNGVRVVDDGGLVRAAPGLGDRSFDEGPILVSGNVAAVVAADGVLHVVSAKDK